MSTQHAAHIMQSTIVRQVMWKPQPPATSS